MRQTDLGGTVTQLLYDGVNLIAEYDASNNVLRRYVHGPGIDEPLVWYEGAGTTSKTWLYADHQGSIVGQADATGTSTAIYSYGPFGEPNQTAGTRFRYTGQQYLSQLGLYYYKARFYSPMLGRFLQTDPIGYADDANLYAYVGNSPIDRRDPTGLFASPWHIYIGYQVGRELGMGVWDSLRLGWYNAFHDFVSGSQDAQNANWHAMATPDQTREEAAVGTSAFIATMLASGTFPDAGRALGADNDRFAAGHAGYQTYDGLTSLFTTSEGWHHMIGDWFPSTESVRAAISSGVDLLRGAGWTGGGPPLPTVGATSSTLGGGTFGGLSGGAARK